MIENWSKLQHLSLCMVGKVDSSVPRCICTDDTPERQPANQHILLDLPLIIVMNPVKLLIVKASNHRMGCLFNYET